MSLWIGLCGCLMALVGLAIAVVQIADLRRRVDMLEQQLFRDRFRRQ